jgi:polyisoprenoid-binding protein YceI
MKTILIFLFCISIHTTELKDEKFSIAETKIIFTSETSEETIKGIGKLATGNISIKEKTFLIEIDLSDWKTNNKLQTNHMHDNYLETEKFPKANYQGNILSYNNTTGEAELSGLLKLHGVEKKDFKTKGKLIKKGNAYIYTSEFILNLKDFKIDVPKLLILKLSENIKVNCTFNISQVN